MAKDKKDEKKQGFVIVCPEKGVFLGGGRWSSTEDAKKGVKKAPVFATADEDEPERLRTRPDLARRGKETKRQKFEGFTGGEFKEVEVDGSGFISLTDLESAGCDLCRKERVTVGGEMGEGAGEEETTTPRRRSRRH